MKVAPKSMVLSIANGIEPGPGNGALPPVLGPADGIEPGPENGALPQGLGLADGIEPCVEAAEVFFADETPNLVRRKVVTLPTISNTPCLACSKKSPKPFLDFPISS
uniref:Uncharacterized protein MANES_15G079400 n=1 Tax=Rhizophora mucronata TaxID=61149 RepID=A0A2P2K2T2_RHIMU